MTEGSSGEGQQHMEAVLGQGVRYERQKVHLSAPASSVSASNIFLRASRWRLPGYLAAPTAAVGQTM